jgi:uncharacterized repeat protein (TIGR03803 family)
VKARIKDSLLLPAVIAGLNLVPVGGVTAQTFTTLHSFSGASDGGNPVAGLVTNSSGNILYGTAKSGGSSGNGTVFAVHTDGTGFTNLYSFTAMSAAPDYTNSDGAGPSGSLVLSGGTLYGTAGGGGSAGVGTVFAVHTDGTGFTNLHSFAAISNSYPHGNSDGAYPLAGLIVSGDTLYGTAIWGGTSGVGAVFAVRTDGTGFTNLHSFTAVDPTYNTNSEGVYPRCSLVLSDNILYGTAEQGGDSGNGTVFAIKTDGTGFTNLHSFTGGSDGTGPWAGLTISGNTLYGTAIGGGSSDWGTVFAINTDGTGFTNLHSFDGDNDGGHPRAALILRGNSLYGTAYELGSSGSGTVFAVHTDGTGFTSLHGFNFSDGANPQAGLILLGNTLYGTTSAGGSSDNGTVFSLSFRPQLTITPSGTNVVLSWPVSYAGFSYVGYYLQETKNLLSADGWAVPDPFPPIIVTGQYQVTRPILGPQISYRLAQ